MDQHDFVEELNYAAWVRRENRHAEARKFRHRQNRPLYVFAAAGWLFLAITLARAYMNGAGG